MSGRTHELQLPLADEQVKELAVGDMVLLSGEITVSIGLPTHQRMVQSINDGVPLPVDLRGGAFFHLSTYLKEVPGALPQPLYMNPSTSTRYNAYMPTLIRSLGLKLVGGKGGLDAASVAAMREAGCAYLSFLGGGCTLLAQSIESCVASNWNEYISQFRLVTLKVRTLGPATVGIDAHGNSVYESLRGQALERRAQILNELNHQRRMAAGTAPG
ncbi:MAG TPA: fumarate hydratase C-terminal domain-containing protein [Burkholderiales bacterium]|jgi:fumarate hydratase subunit beta